MGRIFPICALTMMAVLGFFVVIQFDNVQQSVAQNITSGKISFQNSSFGFQMNYPDEWQIVNEYKRMPTFENLQLGMLLFFLPQGILSSDHNSTFWIETEYLPNRFMPLNKFVDSEIEGIYGGQAEIISRSPISIGGHAAEKVELLCCGLDDGLHEARIYLIEDELGYTMVYSADPSSLYLLFLNEADDAVKSFRLLNENNTQLISNISQPQANSILNTSNINK